MSLRLVLSGVEGEDMLYEVHKKRLSAKGFSMKEGETVKDMGARYNTTPPSNL